MATPKEEMELSFSLGLTRMNADKHKGYITVAAPNRIAPPGACSVHEHFALRAPAVRSCDWITQRMAISTSAEIMARTAAARKRPCVVQWALINCPASMGPMIEPNRPTPKPAPIPLVKDLLFFER